MITEVFLSANMLVINAILSIIPSTPSLPSGLTDSISSVFGFIGSIGYFIPLGTFSAVVLIIFAMYNIKIVVDFVSWIIRKIPTMAG